MVVFSTVYKYICTPVLNGVQWMCNFFCRCGGVHSEQTINIGEVHIVDQRSGNAQQPTTAPLSLQQIGMAKADKARDDTVKAGAEAEKRKEAEAEEEKRKKEAEKRTKAAIENVVKIGGELEVAKEKANKSDEKAKRKKRKALKEDEKAREAEADAVKDKEAANNKQIEYDAAQKTLLDLSM
uniref:4F5 domain-containing protein n=1 Tax=Globodera pallida TaxID=36090 RepID=A0A183BUE5_GLOPA